MIKCPDKEISIVDDTECVKVLSNKRLWVKAVAAVAGVQLDAGDDDSAASGGSKWERNYTLGNTPGWKSLLEARYEASKKTAVEEDEEPPKKKLFADTEPSCNKSPAITRALAHVFRSEPLLIDVSLGGDRFIRMERTATRMGAPVIALTPENIERFITYLAEDLTLESLTPRAYGQNDVKGVYTKTITTTKGNSLAYNFTVTDEGKHVYVAESDGDADGDADELDSDHGQQVNSDFDVLDADTIPNEGDLIS